MSDIDRSQSETFKTKTSSGDFRIDVPDDEIWYIEHWEYTNTDDERDRVADSTTLSITTEGSVVEKGIADISDAERTKTESDFNGPANSFDFGEYAWPGDVIFCEVSSPTEDCKVTVKARRVA